MGQGVRASLGYGGITCVLQTQFSSFNLDLDSFTLSNPPLTSPPQKKKIVFRLGSF